ncbi:hypothetical protein URS_2233 [Acinetobacter ursingii]|nr:hypothetical protein URS_2233 [Acinetobacter ursingii]
MSRCTFLNGVCRHELRCNLMAVTRLFLNGVCRHELCKNIMTLQ